VWHRVRLFMHAFTRASKIELADVLQYISMWCIWINIESSDKFYHLATHLHLCASELRNWLQDDSGFKSVQRYRAAACSSTVSARLATFVPL
jgi:hypothetical protein